MNTHSLRGGGGLETPTKFLKKGALAGSQFLEGGLLGKRGSHFLRGLQFFHK